MTGRETLHRPILPFFLLLLFSWILPPILPAAEIPPTRVAVLSFDIVGEEVPAGSGEKAADLLTTELARGGRYDLVERLQVDKVIAETGHQKSGAVDPSTAVALGRQLGASLVVTGSVYKTGGNIVLSGRFLDVETARVVLSETASGAPAAGFVPLARALAASLKKHEETESTAMLEKAKTLQKRGRMENALKEYEAVLSAYPRSSVADDALFLRGKAYFDEGDYFESVASFEDLMDTFIESPYNEDALFYTAESRYFTAFGNPDRMEDAIRNYKEWLERYRSGTDARERIVTRAQVAKDAKRDYELLLDLYPNTKHKKTCGERLAEIAAHGGL